MSDNNKLQRETKQRLIVYQTVKSRKDHPTAEDIFLQIHKDYPKISRGTVYRNLKILSDNGDIRHIKTFGADRYDSLLENHCHLVCLKCGKVIDAPIQYSQINDNIVQQNSDFIITSHRTIFEGICPQCQKEELK